MDKIGKIKAGINFAAYIARYTNGLKPSGGGGRYYVGRCPFHQAGKKYYRPKFWVDTEKGICNCFNPRCRSERPMDIINFYARINNTSNKQAIAELLREVE